MYTGFLRSFTWYFQFSCDRGSGRCPKLKKTAKRSCTIYTTGQNRQSPILGALLDALAGLSGCRNFVCEKISPWRFHSRLERVETPSGSGLMKFSNLPIWAKNVSALLTSFFLLSFFLLSSFQRFSWSDFWPTSNHRRITKFGTQLLYDVLQGCFLENSKIFDFFDDFRLFEIQDLGDFMAAIRGNFRSTLKQLPVIAALSNLVWSFYAMIPSGPRWKFL